MASIGVKPLESAMSGGLTKNSMSWAWVAERAIVAAKVPMPTPVSTSRLPTGTIQSGSSAPGRQLRARERFMKKTSRKGTDELRPGYKRSDLGRLARGKYAQRVAEATNVVVLDSRLAKAFPNDRAVNKALRGLLRKRKSSPRPTKRSPRARRERRAG
jgi:hypothetical protein